MRRGEETRAVNSSERFVANRVAASSPLPTATFAEGPEGRAYNIRGEHHLHEMSVRGANNSEKHLAHRVALPAPSATTQPHRTLAPPPAPAGPDDRGYVFGANEASHESGCCAVILTALSYLLVIMFFPFSLCATIKVVQEYERAVIFRLGRLLPGGAKGPGIFFVMPCIEEYSKVDLRTVSFDVPPQEVLTRDSVTVSVDAVVYYRISSPTISVANVENAANSTQLLAQTSLRNVLGTQNLSEILSNREHISDQMQNVLDDATDKWGIKVERVEIKDVRLPTQLQRAMAAEAEAARDARAKVIAAEGEQKASLALKEAADIIMQSPAAIQLRYLQTLNSISAEKNSTIIFPLPIDMVQSFMSGSK